MDEIELNNLFLQFGAGQPRENWNLSRKTNLIVLHGRTKFFDSHHDKALIKSRGACNNVADRLRARQQLFESFG
jgi:hypothetical protein